jgi:type II secretory pathway pseudopilin PulG
MKNKNSQPARLDSAKRAGRQGFTLVELLIYIGLLTILMTILTRIFTGIADVQLESEATGAVEEDGRYIYSRLAYDLTRATSIFTPSVLGDQTNTLSVLIDGIANTYGVSSNNLVLANGQGAHQLNSEGTTISNASFRRLGNAGGKDSIQVKFTITSTTRRVQGPDTKDFETTIALR